MKNNSLFIATLLSIIAVSGACKKDKKNETPPPVPVSRLYISNSGLDDVNMTIFDPADAVPFPQPMSLTSNLPDAVGIFFDASSGIVFQVSRQDKTIKTFIVNNDGSLTFRSSFTDAGLASPRKIAYDKTRNILYISSDTDQAIYVYNNAKDLSGAVTASKKLELSGRPQGICLDNDRLFVAIDGSPAQVQLFNNVSTLASGLVMPSGSMTIAYATRLHGITYSAKRDILLFTDTGYETAAQVPINGTPYNEDGKIFLIEGANAKFLPNGNPNVLANYTSSGNPLGNPVDITFDDREGKNLIYVAEKANKKIIVRQYDGSDMANVTTQDLTTSPEAIYLDAR